MLEVSEGKYVFTKGGGIYYIKEVVTQGELYKGIKATAYDKSLYYIKQEDIEHIADEICKNISIE